MKAAQISEYGDSSVLQINEVEKPVPKPKQVVVEVYAASLNPFDTSVRAGYVKDSMPIQLPATLGGDIAGVVSEVGDNVDSLGVGDKVYGQASVVAGNSGAFAEFAATSAKQIAKSPSNLDFKQAASLPLVGVSAMQAVSEHIDLKPGQKIFIHGGAGGIGTIAIQIAKHLGAYVATTATGDGISLVKNLGADEIIDYRSRDFSEVLNGFDAVFDTVGGDDFNKSFPILKKGGIAVTMIAQPDEAKARELGVTVVRQGTRVNTKKLNLLTKLVEEGVLVPQVNKVFPLEKIKEAFEAREGGATKGKVVITIKGG
ncbi:MAG TPA: NADP-dependent oxidoreductase [Candidatus Saccharimonadales bacterium]|nr:NADP-dependent oxidoreductase [Candidatus Saccharimonadales bacterium]